MAKMADSRTKGECLTKKFDIWRTTDRGEVYELGFGSIKKETVRLNIIVQQLNTRSLMSLESLASYSEDSAH